LSGRNDNNIAVSIVVPVFNEAHCISAFLENLRSALAAVSWTYETIVVDDGSADGTWHKLRAFEGAGTRIIRHASNRGYGASLKTGINTARGKFVCIIDGDDSYIPQEIAVLGALREGYDMVVGARMRGDAAQFPLHQRLAKGLVCFVLRVVFRTRVFDLNSGFRFIRTAMVKQYMPLLPDGFSFTSSITLIGLMEHAAIRYVPISYKRRAGASKVAVFDFVVKFLVSYWRIIRWKMKPQ
jgi:glycosyltransferase involved in cell wall biosynthesis